jgi:hypothetical protein
VVACGKNLIRRRGEATKTSMDEKPKKKKKTPARSGGKPDE